MQATSIWRSISVPSGRVVAGHFDGTGSRLSRCTGSPNGPVNVRGTLYWDVLRLWSDIKTGLGKAAELYGGRIAGIGLDTWGVDYGLLDRDGTLLGNPYHYRDSRTDGMMEATFRKVPRAESSHAPESSSCSSTPCTSSWPWSRRGHPCWMSRIGSRPCPI